MQSLKQDIDKYYRIYVTNQSNNICETIRESST